MTVSRIRDSWWRVALGGMAFLPVLALAALVWTLVLESRLAVSQLGFAHLFSTEYSGRYGAGLDLYGLVPPIWGTVLVTAVAMAVAFPVAMAFALLTTDYAIRLLSRVMDAVLGVLFGVPPIVYALMGVVLVRAFVSPKLAGEGLSPDTVSKLPGLPPWNPGLLPGSMPNSALLAGLLLGLWVTPFMVPLLQDALRSVPTSIREASWALGATRWHTVRHVVLPLAIPGIASAVVLGMLKCAGEVVIVSFVVGYEGSLPSPLWDVLERVPVLTATGAGLQGGLGAGAEGRSLVDSSVASFCALLLLGLAALVVAFTGWLEQGWRRRWAA